MVVDKSVTQVALKPTIRGLYFHLASISDQFGYAYFPYRVASKYIAMGFINRYIKALERVNLIKKEYKYFKTRDGIIAKRNRYKIIIEEPITIPEEIIALAEDKKLTLKEKGVYYSLYLMTDKYGEIHAFVKELAHYFDMSYPHFSANLRTLENLDLIKREKGRIIVNAPENVFV